MRKWLIRMKDQKILGPASKEKILELYHNKSLSGDDEVCSGNGYWFYIREKELLERYLLGNQEQSFGFFSGIDQDAPANERKEDEEYSTDQDDFDHPDITLVSSVDTDQDDKIEDQEIEAENAGPAIHYPAGEDLSYPEVDNRPPTRVHPFPKPQKRSQKQRDDRYLILIFFILLTILGMILKKYTGIFTFI